MTNTARRIYYGSAFLVFLFVAPLVLLYTMGFRYDTAQRSIYRTGVLVVESDPRNATVWVNDSVRGTTPLRLENLTPGIVSVRVELDEYAPWTKQLAVRGNKATLATAITLFRENPPATPLTIDRIQKVFCSPSVDDFLTVHTESTSTQVGWWSSSGERRAEMRLSDFEISDVRWSPRNHFVLMLIERDGGEPRIFLWDRDDGYRDVTDALGANWEQLRWDDREPSILYAVTAELIRVFQLPELHFAEEKSVSVTGNVSLLIEGTTVYETNRTLNGDSVLQTFDILSSDSPQQRATLPGGPYVWSLIDQWAVGIAPSTKTLGAFPLTQPETPPFLIQNVVGIAPSIFSNQLTGWSTTEAFHIDLRDGSRTLLTRSSEPLKYAAWYPDGPYTLLVAGSTLQVLENDERDHRNTHVLHTDVETFCALTPNGRRAIVLTPDGSLTQLKLR